MDFSCIYVKVSKKMPTLTNSCKIHKCNLQPIVMANLPHCFCLLLFCFSWIVLRLIFCPIKKKKKNQYIIRVCRHLKTESGDTPRKSYDPYPTLVEIRGGTTFLQKRSKLYRYLLVSLIVKNLKLHTRWVYFAYFGVK